MITTKTDLFDSIIGSDDKTNMERKISKAIYKGTDCGAWIIFNDDGVTVGSIVEGEDQCTTNHELKYPFDIKTFWNELEEVEFEAREIWYRIDDCGFDGEVNPDCETCNGDGIIPEN